MKANYLTRTKKVVTAFLAVIILSFLQGCMYYYKVQTINKITPPEIRKFDSLKKYLILHQGDSAWNLSFPTVTDNIISGKLSVLPDYHWKFKTTKTHGGNRYRNTRKHDESYVIGEVHLYMQDSLSPKINSGDSIKIAYSAIRKAEVYKKAKGRTAVSWLIPGILGPLIGLPAVMIIAFALSWRGPG